MFAILKEIVVLEDIAELGSIKVIVEDDKPQDKIPVEGVIMLQVEFGYGMIEGGKATDITEFATNAADCLTIKV